MADSGNITECQTSRFDNILMTTKHLKCYPIGLTILLIGNTLFINSCGTTRQPPTEAMTNAELAIKRAQTQAASSLATTELQQAQEKWQQANTALQEANYDQAAQLAEQATMDAKLAETKAITAKLRQDIKQIQQSITEEEEK